MLGVGRELLEARDTDMIEGVIREYETDPELVRHFKGRLALDFPDGSEREPIWLDPHIRAWGRQLYERVPHFLYYLFPDPRAEPLALLATAFCHPDQIGSVSNVEQADAEAADLLLPVFAEHLITAAVFAERMADDWSAIVDDFVRLMSNDLGRSVRNTVEASLVLAGEG